MNLKVFLGNAPWYKKGFYGVRAGSRWPHFEAVTNCYMPFPFQLAYAASILEASGIEVLLVDGIAEKITEEQFIRRILQFKPNFVFLEVSTPSFNYDIQFTEKLREVVGRNVNIALGGPHAPMFECQFLDRYPFVDFALVGEYELTLKLLAHNLKQEVELCTVPGILYRNQKGKAVSNGQPKIFHDLDKMPWPARKFLPMHNYHDNPGEIPSPSLQLWSSRGCPFGCSFCIWPQLMNGNRYRSRKVASILDEIEDVCAAYDFKSFYFDDDTFNIEKNRILQFSGEKIKRRIDLPWAMMARADLMDGEILESLAASGLRAIKYGIESASPELIKNANKKLDLKKAIENVLLTKAMGIKVHLTFMFGLPGENHNTVDATIRLAKKLSPDSAQFSILTPLPGTAIYSELLRKGHLLIKDYDMYNGNGNSVIRTDALSSEDLEKALRKAWSAWFRHKAISRASRPSIRHVMQKMPGYLKNPLSSLKQLKKILYG